MLNPAPMTARLPAMDLDGARAFYEGALELDPGGP